MSITAEQARPIWGSMFRATRFGNLAWREDLEPSPDDPRSIPINYIINEELFPIPQQSEFETSHLIKTGRDTYSSEVAENTNISGLLRMVDLMGPAVPEPEEVLIVGSMSYTGLKAADMWLDRHNWPNAKIRLVDKSKVPIEEIAQLHSRGYLPLSHEFDLIHSDIRNYYPGKKPDIVIADILNPYLGSYIATPALDRKSPYEPYERFLKHIKEIAPGSWFFSRCFVVPERRKQFSRKQQPMYTVTNDELETAWSQLAPDLSAVLNKETVLDTPGTFSGFSPPQFCGLFLEYKEYRARNIIVGPKAERVYRRLYRRNFENLDSVTVTDKNNRTFISFTANIDNP